MGECDLLQAPFHAAARHPGIGAWARAEVRGDDLVRGERVLLSNVELVSEAKSRTEEQRQMRIAAVGDLHCTKESSGLLRPLFAHVESSADVLLLCGDLTDYGTPEEAHVLVRELAIVKQPIIAVLGNHDFESGHA